MRKLLIIVVLVVGGFSTFAQDRIQSIRNELTAMSVEYAGLDEPVNLRVTGTSLQAFITAIANTHGLNVSVSNDIEGEIVNNFTNATVSDVFIFLCQEYDLEIKKIGESILSFRKYEPLVVPQKIERRVPEVAYSDSTHLLSLDLKNDSLDEVAKMITQLTLSNVILDPAVKNDMVSVYIQNRPLENALEMLAFANGMKIRKDNNFYVLEKAVTAPESGTGNNRNKGRNNNNYNSNRNTMTDLSIKEENGRISVSAKNAPLIDLISEVSKEMKKNYFVNSEIKGTTTIFVENAEYEEFLSYVFSGTEYGYKNFNNVYLLGETGSGGMRVNRVIPIKNRVVEKITELLPAYVKDGVEIMEYLGTNSLIISGPAQKVHDIEELVTQLDQVVPNVLISVMILNITKSNTFSAGVQMGLNPDGNGTTNTNGTLIDNSNGANLTLSTQSINNLVNGINGLGIINIGQVTPNLYMSVSAMEQNGVLKVKSTPSISAQNGVEASLSIGETSYYFEAQNSLTAIANTGTSQNLFTNSGTYKPLQADLSIKIRPIATNEEYVTLKITVDQKSFTERVGDNGPIGTVNRSFDSMIRVKNGEMLLLGGLDEKSMDDSGSGVPGISKIPILKWFFGKRTKKRDSGKLAVLIQPTVSY